MLNQLLLAHQTAENPNLKGDIQHLFSQLSPDQITKLSQLSGDAWHTEVEQLIANSIDQLRLDERFILQISDVAAAILEKDPDAPTIPEFIAQMMKEKSDIEDQESPESIWQDVALYITALISLLETGAPTAVPAHYQPMLDQLLRFQ